MTPWQRIQDWERADKTKEQSTLAYINADMQRRFPGRYRIARKLTPVKGWEPYHVIVFDTPAEESMFILKWGS